MSATKRAAKAALNNPEKQAAEPSLKQRVNMALERYAQARVMLAQAATELQGLLDQCLPEPEVEPATAPEQETAAAQA